MQTRPHPQLSVVVPVYNAWPYVCECVDAILDQGLDEEAYEVVLVDDGSTDGSCAYIDRMAREHANFTVLHQPNSGTAAVPRNAGLDHARGDWVFFCDADDQLLPGSMEAMLRHAREDGFDVGVFRIDKSEWNAGTYAGLFDRDRLGCTVHDAPLLANMGPYKLFRRAFLLEAGLRFTPGIGIEDLVFCLQCYFAAGRISVFGDQYYYRYRKRDDGRSVSMGTLSSVYDRWETLFSGLETYLDVARAHATPKELPYAYRRAFVWGIDMLRAIHSQGVTGEQVAQVAHALEPYWCEEVRACLPFNRLVACDALMHVRPGAPLLRECLDVAAGLAMPHVEGEGARASYRVAAPDGSTLLEAPFPDYAQVQAWERNPVFAKHRVDEVGASGGTLRLAGTSLVVGEGVERAEEVSVVLRSRGGRASLAFPAGAAHGMRLYEGMGACSLTWGAEVPLEELGALLQGEKAVVDVCVAVQEGGKPIKRHRVGACRRPGCAEAFLEAGEGAPLPFRLRPKLTKNDAFCLVLRGQGAGRGGTEPGMHGGKTPVGV